MSKEVIWALAIVTHVVQLVTIIACILYLVDRRKNSPYRLFAIGWIIILLQDLAMAIIGFFHRTNNLWVYDIALPIQQAFCMFIFIQLLGKRSWIMIIPGFLFAAALNYFFWQGPVQLDTMSIGLGGILIVILAFAKIYQLYKDDVIHNFFKEPAFWISAGFILFWGFGSPFFAMYNFLWNANHNFFYIYFYTVNFGFLILLNLSIIKALQCSLNTRRSLVS